MTTLALPMMAPAKAAAETVGASCRFHFPGFEIRQRNKEEAKELGTDEKRASIKRSGGLGFAPEFDGLHCYENLICS
ncbi:hypothetical protein SUGI_0541740 [Cryptomeria japonica]|nr:hypothetical protein SUGI_0541740 [Cryptomeria japonica]